MNVADVDLFGRTFKLTKTREPYRSQEGSVFHRWAYTEAGVQIGLLRSVSSGEWKAFVHFDEQEPFERQFVFWGLSSLEPDGAVKTLQESILSVAGLLSNVLRGNELT